MRTISELRAVAWRSLVQGLGLADALRYKVLFEPGTGDYAREREQLFAGIPFDSWLRELERWETRRGGDPHRAREAPEP